MKSNLIAIFLTGCGVAHGGSQGNGMVCLSQGEYDDMLLKASRPEASKEEAKETRADKSTEGDKSLPEETVARDVAIEPEPQPEPEMVRVAVTERVGGYLALATESYTIDVIKADYLKRSLRYCATSVQTAEGYSCTLHWGRSMINCVAQDANGFRCELAKMDKTFKPTNDLKERENKQ